VVIPAVGGACAGIGIGCCCIACGCGGSRFHFFSPSLWFMALERRRRGLDFGGFGNSNGANIRSLVISRMDLEGEGFEGFPFSSPPRIRCNY
jgi:hypothetical protein